MTAECLKTCASHTVEYDHGRLGGLIDFACRKIDLSFCIISYFLRVCVNIFEILRLKLKMKIIDSRAA